MVDFSSFNVTRKIMANNAPKTPTPNNSEVVEKKQYNMAHPQRMSEPGLSELLNMLDFSNLEKNTPGLIRGGQKGNEGWFHLTPGVLKFIPNKIQQPPAYPESPPTPPTETCGCPHSGHSQSKPENPTPETPASYTPEATATPPENPELSEPGQYSDA